MQVKFGTGSIEGTLSEDVFTLGDMRVRGQTFGEITVENGRVFESGRFSGIVGLAYPALSAYDFTPVFDNIMSQQLVHRCACFPGRQGGRAAEQSELWLGVLGAGLRN